MQFNLKKICLALFCGLGVTASHAAGLNNFLTETKINKETSSIKASMIKEDSDEIPDWLKKSKRLEMILGEDGKSKIENAKVVSKIESPIKGLFAYVIQADVFSDKNPEGKKELYVFYSDKDGRYLFAGLLIDMKEERDVNQMLERYVRGELADNPANALRPQEMYPITLAGAKEKSAEPLYFVVDLSHESGRGGFLNIISLHQQLSKAGQKVKPIKFIMVSAGKDELATGAMALALGNETLNGSGIEKLAEYSRNVKSTNWLQPEAIKKDVAIKQAMGTGVFMLDQNSSQAALAQLDTLPIVYKEIQGNIKNIPLPLTEKDWVDVLTKN